MKVTRCSVDGCDHDGRMKRGMCSTHYQRWQVRGTTDQRPIVPTAERLRRRLKVTANGCLEWTGSRLPRGYGHIWFNGSRTYTHRLAWELANGPIPDGLNVLHHCDNPPCCETEPSEEYPEGHLFLGTQLDNVTDMVAKGRGAGGAWQLARTHCPSNHEYTEANTYVYRGGRYCQTCKAAEQVRNQQARREARRVKAA
jgi:hypothetical protein